MLRPLVNKLLNFVHGLVVILHIFKCYIFLYVKKGWTEGRKTERKKEIKNKERKRKKERTKEKKYRRNIYFKQSNICFTDESILVTMK
jgi:hypothetical protein